MVISWDGKWQYFGPPRTGSVYIHRCLMAPPYFGQTMGSPRHSGDYLPGVECVYISVRNPYTRAYSLWRRVMERKGRTPEAYSFLAFMEELPQMRIHTGRPLRYWMSCVPRNVEMEVIHQERLERDLMRCFRLVTDDRPEEWKNASTIEAPWPYKDRKAVRAVLDWAGGEFKRFGYSKEPDTIAQPILQGR